MLDDGGILLTREAVRHITGELFDVPADMRVVIDLGAMKRTDWALLHALAQLQCAHQICFSAEQWRVAQAAADELHDRIETLLNSERVVA
jgi:hypothetical protein